MKYEKRYSTNYSPQRRRERRDYAEKHNTLRPLCALCASAVNLFSSRTTTYRLLFLTLYARAC
ncbi:MAG: hypothetical protein DMF68_09290 [Acidobacteria bacterium]|nr:MAG: hypothetical protein DMF68_09290 [Acidobacteriota bacterium]